MSVLARSERYLRVPQDKIRFLSSPPCSPVPQNWHFCPESPPMPCLQDDFNLDAVEGIVHLGDGRSIDLSHCRETSRSHFTIVAKGALVAASAAGSSTLQVQVQTQTQEQAQAYGKEQGQENNSASLLPPIIVESYE